MHMILRQAAGRWRRVLKRMCMCCNRLCAVVLSRTDIKSVLRHTSNHHTSAPKLTRSLSSFHLQCILRIERSLHTCSTIPNPAKPTHSQARRAAACPHAARAAAAPQLLPHHPNSRQPGSAPLPLRHPPLPGRSWGHERGDGWWGGGRGGGCCCGCTQGRSGYGAVWRVL